MFSSKSKEKFSSGPKTWDRNKGVDMINNNNDVNFQKPNPDKELEGNLSCDYSSPTPVSHISTVNVSTISKENTKENVPENNSTSKTSDNFDYSLPQNISVEYSTLPRKFSSGNKIACQENGDPKTKLSRAVSFTGISKMHTRSQSLIDISQRPYNSSKKNNLDEVRKMSLNALIEQRRKSMSKLKGLIIPEKVTETTTPQQVIDLPEIKSKGCSYHIYKAFDERSSPFTNSDEGNDIHEPQNLNTSSLMTTPPWKTEDQSYDLPKYSPAFKRKAFSIFSTSSVGSSVSSSLNSSREDLRSCCGELLRTGAPSVAPPVPQRTGKKPPSVNQMEEKCYKTINSTNSSSISDEGFDGILSNMKNIDSQRLKSQSFDVYLNKLSADMQATEEESDNDSAVSSSRSSISHGFSPPLSPFPENLRYDKEHKILSRSNSNSSGGQSLMRTLSSETTVSTSSNGSTLTSGSQASSSSMSSTLSAESRRVLKPQSVEAINRKNVLSLARFSSGQDFKYGSPPVNTLNVGEDNVIINNEEPSLIRLDQNTLAEDVSNLNLHADLEEPSIIEKEGSLEPSSSLESLCFTRKHPVLNEDENTTGYSLSSVPDFDALGNQTQFETSKTTTEIINRCSPDRKEKLDPDFDHLASLKISQKVNCSLDVQNDPILKPVLSNGTSNPNDINSPVITKYSNSQKSVCVSDIKKAFEKAEMILAPSGRIRTANPSSTMNVHHPRVSSVDSTNSDDSFVRISTHYSSASDLQKEQQFGSITSLASSTSLISQQELSQLIEESNQVLEDGGCSQEVVVVVLHRDTEGGSVGITLAGGADCEAKEITVHKVLVGTPAEKDGRIQKGDRILSINGKSMKGLTHQESLSILKTPRPEVVLVVSRYKMDPTDEAQQQRALESAKASSLSPNERGNEIRWGPVVSVTLVKDGAGLGFSLEGGKNSPFGDQLLTVKKIFTGGCAEKSGILFAGDELISVNNVDLSGLSRIEAWALMKKLPDGEVHLNVRHPIS